MWHTFAIFAQLHHTFCMSFLATHVCLFYNHFSIRRIMTFIFIKFVLRSFPSPADVRYSSCKQKLRCRRPRLCIGTRGRFGGSIRDRRDVGRWAECKVSDVMCPPRLETIYKCLIAPLCCSMLIDVGNFLAMNFPCANGKRAKSKLTTQKTVFWILCARFPRKRINLNIEKYTLLTTHNQLLVYEVWRIKNLFLKMIWIKFNLLSLEKILTWIEWIWITLKLTFLAKESSSQSSIQSLNESRLKVASNEFHIFNGNQDGNCRPLRNLTILINVADKHKIRFVSHL